MYWTATLYRPSLQQCHISLFRLLQQPPRLDLESSELPLSVAPGIRRHGHRSRGGCAPPCPECRPPTLPLPWHSNSSVPHWGAPRGCPSLLIALLLSTIAAELTFCSSLVLEEWPLMVQPAVVPKGQRVAWRSPPVQLYSSLNAAVWARHEAQRQLWNERDPWWRIFGKMSGEIPPWSHL
jgi:hypothetical protein